MAAPVRLCLYFSEVKGWNSDDRRQTVSVTRFVAATMAAVLLLSGCASETTPEGLTCIEPPATEVRAVSDLVLGVEPNPVEPGGEATLTLERGGLSSHTVGGAWVHWQCWTEESGWVDTHVIVRGFNATAMRTIEIEKGSEAFVELVGLTVPNSYRALIPDVSPGTYRIVDRVHENRREVTGFVIVVVRDQLWRGASRQEHDR